LDTSKRGSPSVKEQRIDSRPSMYILVDTSETIYGQDSNAHRPAMGK
jgi:hypothetical protein